LFIEPTMKISVQRPDGCEKVHIKFPDIVVCNTRQVIGVVELKYQPRARPTWRKDIGTYDWIERHRDKISVSNVRFQGVEADKHRYALAKDVLFVWAGVHAPWPHQIADENEVSPRFRDSFLELHAETYDGSEPTVR